MMLNGSYWHLSTAGTLPLSNVKTPNLKILRNLFYMKRNWYMDVKLLFNAVRVMGSKIYLIILVSLKRLSACQV